MVQQQHSQSFQLREGQLLGKMTDGVLTKVEPNQVVAAAYEGVVLQAYALVHKDQNLDGVRVFDLGEDVSV